MHNAHRTFELFSLQFSLGNNWENGEEREPLKLGYFTTLFFLKKKKKKSLLEAIPISKWVEISSVLPTIAKL